MGTCPTHPQTRSPARDKVRPLLSRAIAEKWSAGRLAKEAGVSRGVAAGELKALSGKIEKASDEQTGLAVAEAVAVARRVRDRQIGQAERLEGLVDRALADLEAAASVGELDARDLETVVRLREKHWQHVKDMSGLSLAEKLQLAKSKGEAAGKAAAGVLVDAAAMAIGEAVYEVPGDS